MRGLAKLPLTIALLLPWAAVAAPVELRDGYPVTTRKNVFPMSELKLGMKGVGYTVFKGAEAKPFDVEILGVLNGMIGPHRDVILARLTGPEIEFAGVISGMSGSPVYIDGKLLGAVSYRFGAFSKEPIAGITPILSMLDVYGDEVMPAPKAPQGPGAHAAIKVSDFRSREMLPALELPKIAGGAASGDLIPIATPISLAGFTPDVANRLKATLEGAGMVAVVGSAAADSRAALKKRAADRNAPSTAGLVPAGPIAPAAPIAALLLKGDLNAAGTGTVSFVEGDTVLAFGHPFFGFGHVSFPMATAAILHTLASLAGSYKQAAPSLEVGAITHDRLTAIAGDLGKLAPMVPAKVHLTRADDRTRVWDTEVEIVDNELWLPVLLEATIASASSARLGNELGGTMDVTATYALGKKTLSIEDTYSAAPPTGVGSLVARDLGTIAAILERNGVEPANLTGVEVSIRVRPEVELAYLEEVVAERSIVRPGEKVPIAVRLRPFRGVPFNTRIEVTMPKDVEGDVEVYVGGGVELDRRDGQVYGDRVPSDVDDLVRILGERRPGRGLFARAYVQRAGLRSSAELLSSLPPSQRLALADAPGQLRRATTEAFGPETRAPLTKVVVGGVSTSIKVVR